MKILPVKYNHLVCALWLLACCTAVASKNNSRRTMWVSTTGEDSPQCIHDMPASAHGPVPLTHQPCRSLNYALRNIQNEASNTIFITCGIHVLEPFDGLDATLLLNDTTTVIEGTCAGTEWYDELPLIQCTDGANMAFYNIHKVVIKHLVFQDCGEQVQPSDSLSNSSTLYFQDCKTVVIHDSRITITGPYGSGISFIRNDPTIKHVNVHIDFVDIKHNGIHGTGIHFEVLTAMTRCTDLASVNFELNNTYVLHEKGHPSNNPTMRFTGINITVMGDGEGGKITLSNVTVSRTTRGNGISIAVLDRVHGFSVQLTSVVALDLLGWKHSNNTTVHQIPCDEHLSNISQSSSSINSTSYFGIKIEIRGKSTGNHILVRTFCADECRGIPGSAFSIEITDESEKNVVQLKEGCSSGFERGLQVIVTGWARRNVVQVDGLYCSGHKALWGAGGYIEFSGHVQGNLVNLRNNTFVHNHALRGGGIAFVCRDSSINNIIHITDSHLYNNTAHRGGGMFIHIQDTTATSRVEIFDSDYVRNTLLPSEVHAMMGGGVHVEFSTVNATWRTNNIVKFRWCNFLANTAGQGTGGGISVLYKHSLYQGDSGDIVHVNATLLFHNQAAGGSACAFQSLHTHEKRLFRGAIVTNTYSVMANTIHQTLDNDIWLKVQDFVDIMHYTTDLINQAWPVLREEILKPISPSFQVDTNTNIILAKSVQLTVGYLSIMCAASSQGIYAVDSEIVLEANT